VLVRLRRIGILRLLLVGQVVCQMAGPLAGPLSGVAQAQAPVRVMSFNIRYGTAADGEHRWRARRALVAATIRDHAPHVLGVQEALRFQLDELAAALPGYREFGVGREDGKAAGEYAAILVDTARMDVLSSGTFWLSDTPEVPGSTHWGNRITRITSWVRVRDRATGDTVRAYNAHWDHESQPARERSAALLLERIARDSASGDAVLVLGDFNADEANHAFQRLVAPGTGLRDSYRVRHSDAGSVGTFNAFRGDSSGGKIDAVLVGRSWTVLGAGIDRRRWGAALWASDHFAVWAILRN
jgi:endonuclease/exonuclease/phosphatase family metal-dependent hydrolase